jgi:hypothetical protein
MTNENIDNQAISALFGDDPLTAFDQGHAQFLTRNRHKQIGQLLLSKRALFYLNILYRMRLFRGEHELEPLFEDLFESVRPAQSILAGEAYSSDQFREDIDSLFEWKLIDERLEKQRIRGYSDHRKKKYRYRLHDEALAFLIWLEERLLDDLEGGAGDTRNQLEDISGMLGELLRLLRALKVTKVSEEDARRVLYQLSRLDDVTTAINISLNELNAQLFAFITRTYSLASVKQLLAELDHYVRRFLLQVHQLRTGIVGQLEQLAPLQKKMQLAFEVMESERRKAPHLMRRNTLQPDRVWQRMLSFYREGGQMDERCRRLDSTSLEALRKLYAHLRELERKSHRLEDLTDRLQEMAALDEVSVPHDFLAELIASGHGFFDMAEWSMNEKIDPPLPRMVTKKEKQIQVSYITSRKNHSKPGLTMEQAHLLRLKAWLDEKVLRGQAKAQLSEGDYDAFDDLVNVLHTAKVGLLDQGRKLKRVDLQLVVQGEQVTCEVDEFKLGLAEMEICRS